MTLKALQSHVGYVVDSINKISDRNTDAYQDICSMIIRRHNYIFIGLIPISFGQALSYGKLGVSSKFGLPKKIGWPLADLPAFVIPSYFLFKSFQSSLNSDNNNKISTANRMLLGHIVLHYLNRTIYFIFKNRNRVIKKTLKLDMVLSFFILTGIGALNVSLSLISLKSNQRSFDLSFYIGYGLAFYGSFINFTHDAILFNLRDNCDDSVYKIPYGGYFKYVSCANYFGECLEWIGLGIASQSKTIAIAALSSCLTLISRANASHIWYKKKFGKQYPSDRKRIIPFVY